MQVVCLSLKISKINRLYKRFYNNCKKIIHKYKIPKDYTMLLFRQCIGSRDIKENRKI